MLNITVPRSSVPLAGSDAPGNALLDVGQHGFVLFLGPDAQSPLVDIDGTVEQLVRVIRELRTGLASGVRRTLKGVDGDEAASSGSMHRIVDESRCTR